MKFGELSRGAVDFIDDGRLHGLFATPPDDAHFEDVLAKSMAKEPLSPAETAVLIAADGPEQVERLCEAARELKRQVYGNRIVLFAPLYVGSRCINDCGYCGFRRSNWDAARITLDHDQIREQVTALLEMGHKRLIVVFGEHPRYDARFIADTMRRVYSVRAGEAGIRRVSVNAAPLDREGYAIVMEPGIGVYQVFQETYHHETYARYHPGKKHKSDYLWRLDALSRAQEAGIEDVGIGALFGLYDWRFEVLGLVTHACHFRERFGAGPHTVSFPRLQPASGIRLDEQWLVSDADFKRLVAILRLAVPYTGMILTCRESAEIRREILQFGISQIDAGTRLELGGYSRQRTVTPARGPEDTEAPPLTNADTDGTADSESTAGGQELDREQFRLGDMRSLDEVTRQLMEDGHVPSFCTACYRKGRTGPAFMEFAAPGFIQKFCSPNALSTLQEYLVDYASPETRAAGEKLIQREVERMPAEKRKAAVLDRLKAIREANRRDLIV